MSRSLYNRRTLGVIWSPGDTDPDLTDMMKKFQTHLHSKNFVMPERMLTGTDGAAVRTELEAGEFGRLIVAWTGQAPDWKEWISQEAPAAGLHTIHLWDLTPFTRLKDPGDKKPLSPTLAESRNTFEQRRYLKFVQGYFVGSHVPYALRLARMCRSLEHSSNSDLPGNVLIPGDTQDIEIVRLIFDFFVNQDMPRARILNLLRAQQVPPPHGGKFWHPRSSDLILTDPCYIGANRYGRLIQFGAFPAIIEPSLFYAAQSRLSLQMGRKRGRHYPPQNLNSLNWDNHDE